MGIIDEYMKKAQSEMIWCRGDIYKRNLDGEDVLVEKDVLFQHDTVYGTFLRDDDYCYVYDLISAVFDWGTDEKIEEASNALEAHYLYTDIPCTDGMLYINGSTISEVKKIRDRK